MHHLSYPLIKPKDQRLEYDPATNGCLTFAPATVIASSFRNGFAPLGIALYAPTADLH